MNDRGIYTRWRQGRSMSAYVYKAKFGGPGQVVRFTPESRHRRAPRPARAHPHAGGRDVRGSPSQSAVSRGPARSRVPG